AVTAVDDPPRPSPGTHPAPGTQPPPGARPGPGARPAMGQFLRARTTPAKLRLLLAGLVVLCLVWGGLAAWVVSKRASGANDVVGTSEPLSLDGQQIYRALSDADATAASAFLSGGLEPLAARQHRRGRDRAGQQPARPAARSGLSAGGVRPDARHAAPGRP